ncbi:MAG: DeoR/GlpR family DNA-binding transcription regulator [Candidatus Fimivivens sp.]|nr:DeoR/GlpR family DNA-binding transcription regulator [Candidatus Fimivivens sp.]
MKEKRMKDIMDILHQKKFSTIADLAKTLCVSSSTIRRDLIRLTDCEMVVCSKNGVIPVSEMRADPSIVFRTNINAEAKNAISREAAKLVHDNDIIYIDSSSTTLYMTDYLLYKGNLTVITNSIAVAAKLRGSNIKLILIGGKFSDRSHAFTGDMAEECIKKYNFDISFLSSVAVTRLGYAAETVASAAAIRRVIFTHSAKNVLLCDSSKMKLDRAFNIAHIDDFDYIITDDPVNPCTTRAKVIRV